jgi:4,5:9,10-diseco-3-hydroxy-5,9,17-trioxoandrosta-1(10),2-diene-4-oate hydrolase
MSERRPIPEGKYFTASSELRIHYHELGKPSSSKPTIVVLHGSGPGASGYSNFKHNIGALHEAGYHVLAPDYPGYGYSSKPTDVHYTAAFFAQHIHELLLFCGVKSVVPVGNSLGGVVALEYALTYPQMTKKLILMAPGGMDDPIYYAGYQVGLAHMFKWVADRPADESSFRTMLSLLVHNPGEVTDEAVKERFPIALEQPTEVWTRMKTGSYAERLGELTCPILAFWGARDRFIPVAQSLILLQRAKDVKLVISNKAGHWFMIEERADFNRECIDFLGH